jgi:hypothetical protein
MEDGGISYRSDRRPPGDSAWRGGEDWERGEAAGIDIVDDALVANQALLAAMDAPDSGIARWTFNDAHIDNGTALDVWGGHHADLNGPTTGVTGPDRTYTTGGALHFGGSDTVETTLSPSDVGVGGSNPKSIAVWGYPEQFDDGGLFEWGVTDTTGHDFSFRTLEPENVYRTQLWSDADIDFSYGGTNEWVHFVLAWDGATTRVYANGELQGQDTYALNTGESHFRIGIWDTHYFNGNISDVRIYGKGLSESEVSSLYSAGHI